MPRISLLFGDKRAIRAVLSFLRKTKVGQMVTIPPQDEVREDSEGREEDSEEERVEVEGEEGRPGPPTWLFVRERPGKSRSQNGM